MDSNVECEVTIQRMVNILAEFIKKAKACSPPKRLIDDLNIFKMLVEKEMRTTPMLLHVNEIKLCSSREELKRAVKDSECLNVLLEKERSKFNDFKKETIIDITREESTLRSIKEMAACNMAEQRKISEEEIQAAAREHQLKMELLQKERNSFVEKITLINAEKTSREEDLKKIHSKAHDKSIELLAKYDRDIGAKYRLFEKLTLENNILEEEQNKFRTYLENQRELYIQLKEEREQTIMKAFLKGLEDFKRNRAAKIIQRTWRWYRERLLLKKKRKMKKK